MTKHILLVDDEETILGSMADFLQSQGYFVECARELPEAQALLANYRFDLVITDLRLSAVDRSEGLSLVEEIHERYPMTKVILLTAYRTKGVEMEAQQSKVYAVLDKPKPLPELLLIVREALGDEK